MKYGVTLLVDATMYVEVEADSKEEAYDKALDETGAPSICHQCADEVEIGDVIDDYKEQFVDELIRQD